MNLINNIKTEAKYLRISPFIYLFILPFPIIMILVFSLFIWIESSREYTQMILQENSLVENLTFLFLVSGGIYGFKLFVNSRKIVSSKILKIFLLLFSLTLIFIAMEEIAWGQQFLKFETPNIFKKYNAQNELTIHNINALQGKSEIFRILFGIVAFFGLFLTGLYKVFSVPYILSSFVVVILIVSLFDLSDDFYRINREIKIGTHLLSELIEMFIGLFSLLYLIILSRKLRLYPDLTSLIRRENIS